MALGNSGIPDFNCLDLQETNAYEEVTFNSDSEESLNGKISSESDTTEEYSSSDDMICSDIDESLEVDFSSNTADESAEQSSNSSVTSFPDIVFKDQNSLVETNSDNHLLLWPICEYNEQPSESIETNFGTNNVEPKVPNIFSNIPNLPADGLFGLPSSNCLHTATEYLQNSLYGTSGPSATNLPNFTEMNSESSSNNLTDNATAEEHSVYTKEYSMPTLEVITERFESLFTENETGGGIRTKSHKPPLKSKRTRRKSKQ